MKLKLKNIKSLLNENDLSPGNQSSPTQNGTVQKTNYPFSWGNYNFTIKLIEDTDNEGQKYYWPIPVVKKGDSKNNSPEVSNTQSDPLDSVLQAEGSVNQWLGSEFEFAMPRQDLVKWVSEKLGDEIDSNELRDKRAVLSKVTGEDVDLNDPSRRKPQLDLDDQPVQTSRSQNKQVQPSASDRMFNKLDMDSPESLPKQDDQVKPDEDPLKKKPGKDKRFSKLELESKNQNKGFQNFLLERLKKTINRIK